jgi:predicted RNase H-like HicB family nuclease
MNEDGYLVIIERAPHNYAAYSPDLPGCIAAADSYEETLALMREAIKGHLELMREEGMPIPPPSTRAAYVAV